MVLGKLTMNNGTVIGNYVAGAGGGINVCSGGNASITGANIIGNKTGNVGGVDIPNYANTVATLEQCVIRHNHANSNTGGIAARGGRVTLKDCDVLDNTAQNNTSGLLAQNCHLTVENVSVKGNATANSSNAYTPGLTLRNSNYNNFSFTMKGAVTVENNTMAGKADDSIYIHNGRNIAVGGEMTNTVPIKIRMQSGKGEFTSGWKANMGTADLSKYFTSDDNNYQVFLNGNGEAEIGTPPVASVINGDTTMNYGSLSEAVNAWAEGSTLKLLADVTTNSTITVPSGEHTLDLNGHNLKAGSAGYSVITVGSGAELTINDTAGKDGKITGGSVGQNYGGGVTVDGGRLTLIGGTISGNANTYNNIGNCGGGVCTDNSATTVSVTGGVIKNNTTERFGSAIWAGRTENSTFLIGGSAEIVGNISKWTSDKNGEAAVTGSSDPGDLYITFDANGGKGAMDPQLATETSAALNANTFTREGYCFAGWNTQKDGSGTGYYDEDTIELSVDLTLYAQWEESHTHDDGIVFTPWYRTDSLPSKSGSYVLKNDITTAATWTVPAGEINICLNGHTIDADYDHRVITVPDGANLRIYDEGGGVITGGICSGLSVDKAGSAVRIEEGGSLEIHGGTITDNNTVSVFSLGSVKMTGGAVRNTRVDPSVNSVAAWGLEINGNSDSSFTMTGGEISGNVVGVNISVGTMILSGGTICSNSGLYGGLFFNSADAKLKLSGNPVIKDNFANGDTPANIWLYFNNKITIVGELTNDTPIGIIMGSDAAGAGAFTENWESFMKDKEPSDFFTADKSDYNISTKNNEAALVYPVIPDVSTIGYEGDFDGEAYGIIVTAPEGAAVKYGTEEGSYTLDNTPTYTNAGTYTVYYQVSKEKYSPVTGYAVVNIKPINTTVTITGHNTTADYDGTEHKVSGYDAVSDSELYDVTKDFTFTGTAQAERTNAGTTKMGLDAKQFENKNGNFAAVTFNVTDGYIVVNTVYAEITSAPKAKDKLVYNGTEQELITAGSVVGGTFLYAVGSDSVKSPADGQYKTELPKASDVGNYFIWYKVKSDANHNDLSPVCIKVTMAEPVWVTINGVIYTSDNAPAAAASVSLTQGSKTIDVITSGNDGGYYFTVPAGIYNIVVSFGDATVTNLVDITESKTYDMVMPEEDTDSLLDVVDSEKSIVVGGLDTEAESVRAKEGVSSEKNVTVKMTVKAVAGGADTGSTEIQKAYSDKNFEYYDLKAEKTVDTVTSEIKETDNVLEIIIPCSFTDKKELSVCNSNGTDVQALTESDSREEGTFRVDRSAGLVYVYARHLMTYAVGYKPYYNVKSEMTLGSFKGNVSVKITKADGSSIFDKSDVWYENVIFSGIPKGNYIMEITWTDGAQNTLTLPFIIK